MSAIEWCLVFVINGAIIGLGLWKARETHRSVDWFLAARGLPWWMVGLSMFATAVDSGDYVAVAGEAYNSGLSYLSAWWLGLTVGWLVLCYIVILPMQRCGMFTNSEYLELRFGPLTRVVSVFIQIQYRTNVLANVAFSLYVTFHVLTGMGEQAWWLVVAVAAGAAVYTASGGITSVAFTDALQSVVMVLASVILWWTVWDSVGGWSGLDHKLSELDPELPAQLMHVGGNTEAGVPPWLVVVGWMIAMTAYCVVNHSQSMRLLAARSRWDAKMAALLAASITVFVMWFNVSLGVLGRVAFPDLASSDTIFPRLVDRFLADAMTGLAGVVVAGLLASAISTFDSIGSALAAVITRDLYARFLVPNADDRHYLRVSRITTVVVIAVSFIYIPFLKDNTMVGLYLKLTRVAVVPLLTVYLMGVLTPVSRASGSIGMLVGIVCGLSQLISFPGSSELPFWWTNTWWGYVWGVLIPAVTMVAVSVIGGWPTTDELRGLTFLTSRQPADDADPSASSVPDASTWLERSRAAVPSLREHPFPARDGKLSWYRRPAVWTVLLVGFVCYLNLIALW